VTGERSDRTSSGWLVAALVGCALLSIVWLVAGAVVAVAHAFPGTEGGLRAAAAEGDVWARGVLAGMQRSEPLSQLVPDTALAVLVLCFAGLLLVSGARSPAHRLLGTALAASAAAFTLQSWAASQVLGAVTGFEQVDVVPRVLLPVVVCVSYVLAVVRGPRSGPLTHPDPWVLAAVVGAASAAVLCATLLPGSVRCVLLAGVLLPLLGIAGLRRQLSASTSERLRAPARLLFGVLVGTVAVGAALAVVTGVLAWLQWPGLALVDPTTVDQMTSAPSRPPMVLWFWASRLCLPIVAVAVLTSSRRSSAVSAQRWFSRGLVVVLVTATIGCLQVVVDLLMGKFLLLGRHVPPAVNQATTLGVTSLAFLPAFLLVQRAADRLLYGARPAPYGVLAELAAVPRATAGGVPDLAGVAEAVGQGLGATTCRLTVHRPALRDRSYQWVRPGEEEAETSLEVPVRHAGQEVGTIAVDRAAVAGADDQRQDLLGAVANSLGVVLQAVRTGIDLERQLRAALAHAAAIADARRRVVGEADAERRRIERDLHDGAQHHLVSLSLGLGLAEHEVGAGRLEQARARLDQIVEQLDTAEAVLARTTTGLNSAALAGRSAVAALREELGRDPRVRLDTTGVTVARFSPEVEAAVYFCCLESVNNARKHAGGAPVRVRLECAGGRLLFTVEDEGPGWDPQARSGSPGRGVRNMTARLATVGGHLDVRSAPGEGTRIEGWVPLGDPGAARPTPGAVPAPGPLEQVRTMVRRACDLYHGTASVQSLSALTRRLGEPPRIALVGPSPAVVDRTRALLDGALDGPGSPRDRRGWPGGRGSALQGTAVLVPVTSREVLAAAGPVRPAEQLAGDPLAPSSADGVVLLVPSAARGDRCYTELLAITARLRPSQFLGVLLAEEVADEVAGEVAGEEGRVEAPAELRRWCVTAPPAADGVPSNGHERLADVDLGRLVRTRLGARLEALRARAAMEELTALLRRSPPPRDGQSLLYELDRFRLGRHELAELDVLDQLTTEDPRLPAAERLAAERLLGLHGTEAPARLGCGPRADSGQLVRAAEEQLAHWQQVAAHPASSRATRTVARFLVGTCERLLTTVLGETRDVRAPV
jgi:signal transduction histidine kinase